MLVWFGIALAALIVVTVVLVLTIGQGTAPLLPENTPEGVVQRFLLAIQDNDYLAAYGYLNIVENGQKLSYDEWLRSKPPPPPGTRPKPPFTGTTLNMASIHKIQFSILRAWAAIEAMRKKIPEGPCPINLLEFPFFEALFALAFSARLVDNVTRLCVPA